MSLDELHVEGLVHVSLLGQDYFHFDASTQVLRGERPQDLVNPEVWPRVEERLRALRG